MTARGNVNQTDESVLSIYELEVTLIIASFPGCWNRSRTDTNMVMNHVLHHYSVPSVGSAGGICTHRPSPYESDELLLLHRAKLQVEGSNLNHNFQRVASCQLNEPGRSGVVEAHSPAGRDVDKRAGLLGTRQQERTT